MGKSALDYRGRRRLSLPPPLRVPIDIQPLEFLMRSECPNALLRTWNYLTSGGRLDLRRLPSACIAEKNTANSTTLPADVAPPNVGQSRLSFLTTARGPVSASVIRQDPISTHLRSETASSASQAARTKASKRPIEIPAVVDLANQCMLTMSVAASKRRVEIDIGRGSAES